MRPSEALLGCKLDFRNDVFVCVFDVFFCLEDIFLACVCVCACACAYVCERACVWSVSERVCVSVCVCVWTYGRMLASVCIACMSCFQDK